MGMLESNETQEEINLISLKSMQAMEQTERMKIRVARQWEKSHFQTKLKQCKEVLFNAIRMLEWMKTPT
ncbi:hypothetical protein AXF42_Ash003537 [Apostasia shenzhenica]|uniref:Uncharacterized protein n=1 Tax=Apostasia shenzhenica TaxID=1088818 RepID=A0A2I0BGE7_9ASPA|nr:hypothetical protein AXF42_Ash003537 [Apostasia shenzhenica]